MYKTIKIILATLFFICLADMNYGFYQLTRFIALLGFTLLAYNEHNHGRKNEMLVYASLALLFQPFIKISLGRTIWNIVDVIVGLCLILSIFIETNKKIEHNDQK